MIAGLQLRSRNIKADQWKQDILDPNVLMYIEFLVFPIYNIMLLYYSNEVL